jgi:DNA replication initiation complex subunit (GINS family)
MAKKPNLKSAETVYFEDVEAKKLTPEELEELKSTSTVYQNHLVTFATIELSKQEAISRLTEAKSLYEILVARLQEKYGEVNVSLEDGKITAKDPATNI